jgi:hypothetical protein
VDTQGNQIVSEADELIGKETIGGSYHPAAPGLLGKAAGNFRSAIIERAPQQLDRVVAKAVGGKMLQLVGQCAAIDDGAPVWDQRKSGRLSHQPSATSRFSA